MRLSVLASFIIRPSSTYADHVMANILAVIFGLILLAGVSFVGWLAFDWIRLLHRKRRLDKKMRKQMKELDEMFAQLEAQLKESSHE